MRRVYTANTYRSGALGSLGDGSYMLLRQFQFPDEYDEENDKLISADSDRCLERDYEHADRCFQQHTGKAELYLEDWIKQADDEQIFAFLKDILKVDSNIEFTGYRVLGGVHKGNGYPIWTLELFAKHPESTIEVYSDSNAPNVTRNRNHIRR